MTIGVIVSTYNQPRWLALALEGWCQQQRLPDELIIADDGSSSDTRDVIDSFRTRLNIIHVWHPDDGFRKTEILNAAILASTSDYLIFSDGDCIPRQDFVAVHEQHARHRRFLSGGYYKLLMITSDAITAGAITSERITSNTITAGAITAGAITAGQLCFDVQWLRAHGMSRSRKDLKLVVRGRVAALLDAMTTTRATWNGHNASAWRQDLLNVNGFDTRMKYGGEDRELGERLENASIIGYGIRYHAICLHLDHARGYVNAADIARNDEIRAVTKAQHLVRTPHGIAEQDLSSTLTLRGTSVR